MNNSLFTSSQSQFALNYGKFIMKIKYFGLKKKTQKFALPVSICVIEEMSLHHVAQVLCDRGVTMETTLLNSKIKHQNSFILITLFFFHVPSIFSLSNMD